MDNKVEIATHQPEVLSAGAIDAALDFAMERNSSSVVITVDGSIVAERHADLQSPGFIYRNMMHGKSSQGHQIEDVASVQKSIVSVLIAVALQKGLLKIDDPVHKYLGVRWSKATPQQESAIQLRHLISMTSGLNNKLEYDSPAGSKWAYNTTAYAKSFEAVLKVAGESRNEVTRQWLTEPLKMNDSKWVKRKSLRRDSGSAYGFATTARDLARFGSLMLNNGRWDGVVIVDNPGYLAASTTSSQQLNPSYGYLWWLNGQEFVLRGKRKVAGQLVPNAPSDMYAAQGALGRKCYVVPSRKIVVTRLGDNPDSIGQAKFDEEFWRLLDLH